MKDKIEFIKNNKNEAIICLNAELDQIYGVMSSFVEGGEEAILNRKTIPIKIIETIKDEKALEVVEEYLDDADTFESIREKLNENNFDFDLTEINYIGLAFSNVHLSLERQIKLQNKVIEEVLKPAEKTLLTIQKVDF